MYLPFRILPMSRLLLMSPERVILNARRLWCVHFGVGLQPEVTSMLWLIAVPTLAIPSNLIVHQRYKLISLLLTLVF